MEKKEKLTFQQWCENIWYHHKWMLILVGAIVIFLIIALIQFFKRDEPDVNFLYTGKATVTVVGATELEDTVKGFIDDYNKDGVKTVDYLELTALAEETSNAIFNADAKGSSKQRLIAEVTAGDSVIYMLNKYYFDSLIEKDINVIAKLSDVLGESQMPEKTINEYGVYLKDLNIYKTPGFNKLPPETIICIRRSPEKDVLSYGRSMDEYNANKDCFIKLITYK